MGNCNELAVGYADMTPTKRMLWRRSLVDLYAYWEGLESPHQIRRMQMPRCYPVKAKKDLTMPAHSENKAVVIKISMFPNTPSFLGSVWVVEKVRRAGK